MTTEWPQLRAWEIGENRFLFSSLWGPFLLLKPEQEVTSWPLDQGVKWRLGHMEWDYPCQCQLGVQTTWCFGMGRGRVSPQFSGTSEFWSGLFYSNPAHTGFQNAWLALPTTWSRLCGHVQWETWGGEHFLHSTQSQSLEISFNI